MQKLFLSLFMVGFMLYGHGVGAIETAAKQALIIDYNSGRVLFEKDATSRMYPASMTKMLTVFIAFEELKAGRVSEETMVKVSKKAHNMEGSKMFIAEGEEVPLGDILKGIIVVSGNDASVALAETLAGSEEAFSERMNETAARLGMKDSHFTNASGLPDNDHYTTAQDLMTLAKATMEKFPEYYKIYSIPEFSWNNVKQPNRNPILKSTNYLVDGLKTGHTDISGYGITSSAIKGNRRVIMVIHGMKNDKERASESEKLMNWAMNNFALMTIFPEPGNEIFQVAVFEGSKDKIAVGVNKSESMLLPISQRGAMKLTAKFNEPLTAPIAKGQEIGYVMVESPNSDENKKIPLIALESVDNLNFIAKIFNRLHYLLRGGK